MLKKLKRHPLAVTAFFRHSLVLTYAFPQSVLEPLLPPGLALDTYRDYGFMAIALVQTECLRPSLVPAVFGRNFFLSGYRIFTRLASVGGSIRGLRILRSDTDSPWMVRAGNLLTHYNYSFCRVELRDEPGEFACRIRTQDGQADLDVVAATGEKAALPAGSPFETEKDARRFAGPLPYTFDYEAETHSIIRIRGIRQHWDPQPVAVDVRKNTFLARGPFHGATPVLANAFYLRDVPYRWEPGVRIPLETQ